MAKTIDLNFIRNKSLKFKSLHKELLEKRGYHYLIYCGHLDQSPIAVSQYEAEEYASEALLYYLSEGYSEEEATELALEEVTPLEF